MVDKRAELDDVLEKLKRALVTPEMVKERYGNVDALLEPSTTSTARELEPAVPKANGSRARASSTAAAADAADAEAGAHDT